MNQTQNYKLSQWELSDRIQMQDFNGDNAKVEKALASLEKRKLEPMVVLDMKENVSGVNMWKIPLEGLDLGQYFGFFAEVTLPDKTPTCSLQEGVGGRHLTYVSSGKNVLFAFPARNPEMKCILIGFQGGSLPSVGNESFRDLKFLSVYTSSGTLEGSFRFRIWVLP